MSRSRQACWQLCNLWLYFGTKAFKVTSKFSKRHSL